MDPDMVAPEDSETGINNHNNQNVVSIRLYISHFLSAWNSRTFEFGAVLFLASIYPGTLLYASIYALLRNLAATLFSAWVGAYIDMENRLVSIRWSIVYQRLSVVLSCAFLYVLLRFDEYSVLAWVCLPLAIVLACVEKLASIGNTVAVERDWVVVICEEEGLAVDRGNLNATLRRIDLFCKLVAPVFISFVDALGTTWAIATVSVMSGLSAGVEYYAIAQVYRSIPGLATKSLINEPGEEERQLATRKMSFRNLAKDALDPWVSYTHSPVFLASLSLSLLYLTVLSTGVHWQTYMLSLHYTPLTTSLLRVLAVLAELTATFIAPYLMSRIGPIRASLWSVNYQVLCLAFAVFTFHYFNDTSSSHIAALCLTGGIVLSRLGLWSFDLSVQYIVQDGTTPATRSLFSSCEIALQSLFELFSFAVTIAWPKPEDYAYPVFISYAAVVVAAACFAGFVRKERGHLLHGSRCLGACGPSEEGSRGRYARVGRDLELDRI